MAARTDCEFNAMTNPDNCESQPDPVATFFTILFSFRGRIGRAKYWIGFAATIATAFLTLFLLAEANRPTGGGSIVLLGFPLGILFLWFHLAVTTKRLRDAGFPTTGIVLYVLAPLVWMVATIELFEYIWVLIFLVLAALIAIPGVLKSVGTPAN
jgi:uncharacterized membrane protein YhaH (DUF805 family)